MDRDELIEMLAPPVGALGYELVDVMYRPGQGNGLLRLYIDADGQRVACRQCLGLTHRSSQQHDARVDFARRDAEGFAEARKRHRGVNSALVTFGIAQRAFAAMLAPRRGRGWGQTSPTQWKRLAAELMRDAG